VSHPCHSVHVVTDWRDITNAIGLALGGDQPRGRESLLACWETTTDTDHSQRCVLAHYLADLQSSLQDEVAWDERALSEHAYVVDEDLAPVGMASALALAPSLHLNLGDGYLRQGRLDDARTQLRAGMKAVSALPMDGYGALVRSGLVRLQQRLQEAEDQ
jgi:hypothetical protein